MAIEMKSATSVVTCFESHDVVPWCSLVNVAVPIGRPSTGRAPAITNITPISPWLDKDP